MKPLWLLEVVAYKSFQLHMRSNFTHKQNFDISEECSLAGGSCSVRLNCIEHLSILDVQ